MKPIPYRTMPINKLTFTRLNKKSIILVYFILFNEPFIIKMAIVYKQTYNSNDTSKDKLPMLSIFFSPDNNMD